MIRWLPLLLLLGGCAASRNPSADPPVVAHEADLKRHDGQVVRLVGIYRPLAMPWKMREPAKHFGHAAVQVEKEWIQLGVGPRPASERFHWTGRRVEVVGRLVLRPPLRYPPHVAQPLPNPTLYMKGPIRAWQP